MTWTPQTFLPAAVFTKVVLNNAKAILVRDFKPAADHYFPELRYPDFKDVSIGMVKELQFPSAGIIPRRTDTQIAEDGSFIMVETTFDTYLGVTGKDDQVVTDLIQDYVGIIDAVYRNAEPEFCSGISNPHEIFIELSHDYGPRGSQETLIFRGAIVHTTVNFRQR